MTPRKPHKPLFKLIVEHGARKGGKYRAGRLVNIAAMKPKGMMFTSWASSPDTIIMERQKRWTTLVMPAHDETVTARYAPIVLPVRGPAQTQPYVLMALTVKGPQRYARGRNISYLICMGNRRVRLGRTWIEKMGQPATKGVE